jgi:hypothetical protein
MRDELIYTEEGDIIIPDSEAEARQALPDMEHNSNLAEYLPSDVLQRMGSTLTEELAHDLNGRADFEKLAARYMEALGIGPESEPDDFEYEFSDTSTHPLLLKALTNFQAKALSALMPSPTRIANAAPAIDLDSIEDPMVRKEAKRRLSKAVERVEKFYNWYLLDALPSYEEDTDQIIHDSGLHGIGFRRIGVDRSYIKTPVRPMFVSLEDLIISYDTKNFRTGRVSHRRRETATDLVRAMQNGHYVARDVVPGVNFDASELTRTRDRMFGVQQSIQDAMGGHVLYDVFTYLFLADDPHPQMLARPYVVTIHQQTQEVLAVRRNWREGDPDETPIEHFSGYVYSPGRNAVTSIGLGALLTNMTLALRTAQRRALDAAYLANHPSGFVVGGMSIRDDSTPFKPGELRPVDVGNGDIRQSIMLNPFKGPDAGLMGLYDRMNEAGKELGNIASIDFAAMMKSGIAAGPALAAYDESTEFQTSVHRRLYRGHAVELRIIHEHMREIYGGQRVPFGDGMFLEPDDLLITKAIPAMKPGHVSRQRALMEAQSAYEIATANPQEVSTREAISRLFEAMGTPQIEDLIIPDPSEAEIPATDPVNEYMRLMQGNPLRAAPQQNHRAHIDAHVAQLRGLQSSALPVEQGQVAAATLGAHIAEHEALDLMVQVSARLGIPMEMLAEGIPPEMEAEIAPAIAEAVAEIENARRPKDEQDPRIVVEQMRSENKVIVEQLKAQQADLQRQAQLEITRIREEAATYRNITDNLYAIEIAELNTSGKVPVRPDIPSPPDLRANTPVPRFRMDPR